MKILIAWNIILTIFMIGIILTHTIYKYERPSIYFDKDGLWIGTKREGGGSWTCIIPFPSWHKRNR